MENLGAHLRPLIAVASLVSAANPGIGTNISLYEIDGLERPVLVIFGKPWVVWLYIDSGNFMLRGGQASDRIVQPPRPAAVAAGRVGSAEADLPAKIVGMVRQLLAEVPEQPADKYTWVGAGGYIAKLEGKYTPLPGHYKNLLAPVLNRFPFSDGSGRFQSSIPNPAIAPGLLRDPHLFPPPTAPTVVQHFGPPDGPRPVQAKDETAENPWPATKPVLERSGRIPGLAGAAALLLAVLPLDYSMYGLIRWIVCVSAIWLVVLAASHKAYGWMCAYAVAAVLWNPLFPFGFSRASWLWPDLIGAGMMAFGAYALVSHRREPAGP